MKTEYDVIILGSGAGGMTGASVAAAEGLSVIVIEKSQFVGGTTAVSGGMVWIPANSKMAQAGIPDTNEGARLYLRYTVRDSFNENLRSVFLASGNKAISYVVEKKSVSLRLVQVYA